jgi:hypothetical protein
VITTSTFFIGVYPGLTEEMIRHVLATFDRFVESRGQTTEGRGQKTEVRGQRSED